MDERSLRQTERELKAYLENFHELQHVYPRSRVPSVSDDFPGSSAVKSPWEKWACMRCDVQNAMKALTKKQREAIWRVYVFGQTQIEAAQEMGVHYNSIWRLITRGIQRMAVAVGSEW